MGKSISAVLISGLLLFALMALMPKNTMRKILPFLVSANEAKGTLIYDPALTPKKAGPYMVSDVQIRDSDFKKVLYRGSISIEATLNRIDAFEKLPYSEDGTEYGNHSRQLPKKFKGYYHQYVIPTEGVPGAGHQRLVVGGQGELYYSPDNFETFVRMD